MESQCCKLIKPFTGEGEDNPMMEYEFEPDVKSEVMDDLYKYALTSQIYHSFMDGAAAEQSSMNLSRNQFSHEFMNEFVRIIKPKYTSSNLAFIKFDNNIPPLSDTLLTDLSQFSTYGRVNRLRKLYIKMRLATQM